MICLRRIGLLSLALAVGFSACSGNDETILLVDVDQGSMSAPPTSISIHAYKSEQGTRVKVGSSTGIAWTDAKKGLGLKMAESVAGVLSIEGVGSPSGIADPVSITVVAKKSNGPIKLVFRDGIPQNPDAGVPDGGTPDGDDGGSEAAATAPETGPQDAVQTGETASPVEAGPERPTTTPDGAAATLDAAPDAALDASPDAPAPTPDVGADGTQLVDVALPDAAPRDMESVDAVADGASSMNFTPAQIVDPSSSEKAFTTTVAVDPVRGHVYVAWTERDAIKVRRWSRNTATWGATQSLAVTNAKPFWTGTQMGVDGAGKVHVAWLTDPTYSDPSADGLWVSQAGPAEVPSFSPPQRLVPDGTGIVSMGVAASGFAYMVYNLKDKASPFYAGVYTASFDGNTWTTNPQPLVTPDSQDIGNPSIAVSDMGTAMVVLDRYSNGRRTAAFHLAGTSRKDTGNVDPAATSAISERFVAANRQGEFALAWTLSSSSDLYVAKYNPQTGWTPATFLTNGPLQDYPAAALSEDGTITVAYAKRIAGTYNLAVQTGKLTETFTQPTFLETDNKSAIAFGGTGYDYSVPRLAADTAGNVLLVFHKKESEIASSLWGSRLEKGAWRPPVVLAKTDKLHATYPSLDVADSGFGAFAFLYWDTADPLNNEKVQRIWAGFFQ